MSLLSSIYGLGVFTRNALYNRGTLHSQRLRGPVISVGNISVGGSGKTPFIILLGELLKAKGVKFDILSRGYGRRSSGVLHVNPAGSPVEFGDEPLLLAKKLEVPVIVGESRLEAGLFAEKLFSPQLHILDDGFQHRALARDFDIVLLTPDDLKDSLLPIGRLREPMSSLRRSDALALSEGLSSLPFPLPGKLLWKIQRRIISDGIPPRPVAFCGIARPHVFLSQLRAAGVEPVGEAIYQDHHSYIRRDIDALRKLAERQHAGGFITTEKDAVNLGPHLADLNPIVVVPMKMELEDAANVVDTMLRIIHERKARRERIRN
jgi:tetraacyldisaccharide 4'-kinase